MPKKKQLSGVKSMIGVWAFGIGIFVTILIAIFTALSTSTGSQPLPPWTTIVLAIVGLIVGLINIRASEANTFLIATIAFILASAALNAVFGQLGNSFEWLTAFLGAIVIFASPAAIIVSFKAIYDAARKE